MLRRRHALLLLPDVRKSVVVHARHHLVPVGRTPVGPGPDFKVFFSISAKKDQCYVLE
jgi:hypothetical protein